MYAPSVHDINAVGQTGRVRYYQYSATGYLVKAKKEPNFTMDVLLNGRASDCLVKRLQLMRKVSTM